MLRNEYLAADRILDPEHKELRDLLEKNGICFETVSGTLYLRVDTEGIHRRNQRNAGAKEKGLYISGSPSAPIYLADIERLKDDYTMEQIAAMYNTSRRTLYRRIAEAKRTGSDQLY